MADIPKRRLCFASVFFVALFALVGESGCASNIVKEASADYKATRSLESLTVLESRLEPGMPRAEVAALLGEPDYSPIEGQYYYLSDREAPPSDARASRPPVPVGLVVEYRNDAGEITQTLQSKRFGPIGE